jgi:hypothetical protein
MRTLRHPEDIPPSVLDTSQLTIQPSPLKALNHPFDMDWKAACISVQSVDAKNSLIQQLI